MRNRTCLIVLCLVLMLPMLAAAQTPFETVCVLLAETLQPQDAGYTLYEEALDAVDAVGAGELTVDEALVILVDKRDALREIQRQRRTVDTTQETLTYMLERGILIEDFQAILDAAAMRAGYAADNVDNFIMMWEAYPEFPEQSTELSRIGLLFERRMDFVGDNSVLLPVNDEEAEAIDRLVIAGNQTLLKTGLTWERDMQVCEAKFSALEAAYSDMLNQTLIVLDTIEEELNALLNSLGN